MSGEIHPYCAIRLPNEILAIIINELASDGEDYRTLAALASCRLASHVLYSIAIPLLFSSVQLTERSSPWTDYNDKLVAFKERATKLKQILTTTSNIPVSVHTLTLRCHNANLEDSINSTLISEIIHRLQPHIRTFILEGLTGGLPLEFTEITEDFKSAIKSLCTSPNLTTLDLRKIIDFPFTVITACPNLQCLRLSYVDFSLDRHTSVIDETSIHKLKSLEIDDNTIDCLGLGSSNLISFFSRIKNLRINNFFCERATLRRGWEIMLMASQTLTTLDLSRGDDMYPIHSAFPDALKVISFDLGRFPALRHFKIQIRIWIKDNVTMLGRLNRLLSSISSPTSGIETLEITITWFDVKTGDEMDLFSSHAGWSTLDEVLSSHKFGSLKKVVLGLGLEIAGVGDRSKAYYHNQMDLELGRSSTPPYVNSLFSMFRALINTQRTLELHVETIDPMQEP